LEKSSRYSTLASFTCRRGSNGARNLQRLC
jgi:hypothetical protein